MQLNIKKPSKSLPAKIILLIACVNINCGFADWVNLSGAENAANILEMYVDDGGVKIQFEISPTDLAKFMPNHKGKPTLAFQVLADGKPLPSYIALSEKRERVDRYSPFAGLIDPRTRRKIPGPPADKQVIFIEAFYPFETEPEAITLVPPLGDDQNIEATIGFIAFHNSVPINDFRYLSKSEKLWIEWDDPWFTAFENKNIKRHHSSPLMSFLYLEPYQVRLEGLMRTKDLFEWEGLDLQDAPALDRNTLQKLAEKIFEERTAIEIDGKTLPVDTSRAVFLKITPMGLRADNSADLIDPAASIIGVTQAYWVEHLPESVTVDLDLFTERTDDIPFVMTDPAGPFPGLVSREDPSYVWQNFLTSYVEKMPTPVRVAPATVTVPIISLVLLMIAGFFAIKILLLGEANKKIISGGVSIVCVLLALLGRHVWVTNIINPLQDTVAQSSPQIIAHTLQNIKLAYLQKDPDEFRRTVEQFIEKKQLDEIVYELNQAFAIPVLTGGVASAENIEVIQLDETTTYDSNKHFRTLVTMTVQARSQHWGHADIRIINFRALMELKKIDDNWQLMDFTVLDVKPADMSNQKI